MEVILMHLISLRISLKSMEKLKKTVHIKKTYTMVYDNLLLQ